MQMDWSHLALYVLGLYILYAPFAYKFARNEGNSRTAATVRAIALYVLFYLWIVGGASVVSGLGLVFSRPDESCGIGCIEQGEGHWQAPRIQFLLLGVAVMLAAWFLGKLMEWLQGSLIAKRSVRPKDGKQEALFDIEKLEETRRSFEALWETHKHGDTGALERVPQGDQQKTSYVEEPKSASESE